MLRCLAGVQRLTGFAFPSVRHDCRARVSRRSCANPMHCSNRCGALLRGRRNSELRRFLQWRHGHLPKSPRILSEILTNKER